jgi:hypothetical protein
MFPALVIGDMAPKIPPDDFHAVRTVLEASGFMRRSREPNWRPGFTLYEDERSTGIVPVATGVTVSVPVTVCDIPPETPMIVSVAVPGEVERPADNVMVLERDGTARR